MTYQTLVNDLNQKNTLSHTLESLKNKTRKCLDTSIKSLQKLIHFESSEYISDVNKHNITVWKVKMKTTVKFLASAVALCIMPAANAITLEQAEADLKMASVASHFAEKAYRSALSNEHTTDVAMNNAMDAYGVLSKEAAVAAKVHSNAVDQIQKARQAAKDSRTTLAAARLAFKNLTPTPVPASQRVPQKISPPMKTPVAVPQATPQKLVSTAIPQPMNPPGPISQNVPNKKNVLTAVPTNTTAQIVVTKTQPTTLTPGLPKNAVINPQTPYKSSVTIIDPTTKSTSGIVMISKADNAAKQTTAAVAPKGTATSQTAGSTYNVVAINQVNSYYVSQANNRQVADNSQRIDNNSQRIQSNSQRIDGNSKAIDRNAKEIDDTREELKRGLNNAAAMSSLHYHSDNSWALSTGTANGDGAALAGGLQKGLTSHVAVNMQASTSFDSGWMAGAGISGDF